MPDEVPPHRNLSLRSDRLSTMRRRARRARGIAVDRLGGVRRTCAADAVALTFDDGPHPGSTERVLEILAELNVRATFFCVGKNAERYPSLLRRLRSEGHAIGSHSYSHPHPAQTPLATLASDYRRGRDVVRDILGEDVTLFRPPHGHLTSASAWLVRRQGLEPWLWTVDPEDWRPGASRDHIQGVAGRASGADVVLLHDWIEQPWAPSALDRSATIAALPQIVAAVRERGGKLDLVRP
jgi:peptidoglycan-N-acetylglucosamine deacetylase